MSGYFKVLPTGITVQRIKSVRDILFCECLKCILRSLFFLSFYTSCTYRFQLLRSDNFVTEVIKSIQQNTSPCMYTRVYNMERSGFKKAIVLLYFVQLCILQSLYVTLLGLPSWNDIPRGGVIRVDCFCHCDPDWMDYYESWITLAGRCIQRITGVYEWYSQIKVAHLRIGFR